MTDTVYKKQLSKPQRFLRLLKSIFDPRAIGHGLKVLNYYNYTHVAELAKATRGSDLNISPTASFANGQNIVLGDRVRVGAQTSIWAGNGEARIIIHDDVMIAPNVMITASNYRFNDGAPVTKQAMNEADVVIGKDVWLGYGVIVLPGTQIGDGAIIGAGALVRGHIEPNAIVAGAQATVVGTRFAKRNAPE